nr:hypothetical protein [Pseudomonas syringae group genomosp. 3]
MYAYKAEEFNFYAEAHLPKIKTTFACAADKSQPDYRLTRSSGLSGDS